MISTLDILYLALSLGFLILVGFLSYTLFQTAKTLREIQPLLEDIRDIADDVRQAKDGVKNGFGQAANVIQSLIENHVNRKKD